MSTAACLRSASFPHFPRARLTGASRASGTCATSATRASRRFRCWRATRRLRFRLAGAGQWSCPVRIARRDTRTACRSCGRCRHRTSIEAGSPAWPPPVHCGGRKRHPRRFSKCGRLAGCRHSTVLALLDSASASMADRRPPAGSTIPPDLAVSLSPLIQRLASRADPGANKQVFPDLLDGRDSSAH